MPASPALTGEERKKGESTQPGRNKRSLIARAPIAEGVVRILRWSGSGKGEQRGDTLRETERERGRERERVREKGEEVRLQSPGKRCGRGGGVDGEGGNGEEELPYLADRHGVVP